MQVALNSEGVLKAARDRGASKWKSDRSLHLFPCSQFNDCYQHYPALGLSIKSAKLRGGSSPHYTQAAAWCATHHRVAHTSCLPAKTTGLFFEPYPARSPCSPWLHLTMMLSKRRSVSKPSWSLCWLATLTLHLSTLASLDVFFWPFDMFWRGLTCLDMSWHVLTCFDMFWHVLTGNATWCNILVPCPAITPRELEIDFDRGVALCVVDCRLQPHRSSSRIQLHHIPIWNIHFFHDQLVGKWSFHPSACFILRGVAGNEQLAVHLLVKFSKKIVELRESTCTQLCLPLRWLGNCWQQKELSKLRAMNLRVVRCPFSPDHFSRCSAEKGEHGDIDCTPVILMPWFSHGLNVPNQSLKPLIYSI